jgi:excisionase family DNA binding protein
MKQKRYMTPKQISEERILPYTKRHIENLIKNEGLPHIKMGERGTLIDLDDLDTWLRKRKVYEAS